MAFTAPTALGRRVCSSNAAPPRGVRGARVAPATRRHIRKVAALEEQETASQQQGEQAAAVMASTPETEDAAVAESMRLQELDSAQEELLKWMLYLDEEAQEADLDEMVDYEELGDEEYEEIWDEVDDLLEKSDYDFKTGDKVVGTVYECDEDGAYIEIGAKTAGFVPLSECSLAKLKSVRACFFSLPQPPRDARERRSARN